MSLFTVRRGIAVVGIAGAAAAVALTVPALVTGQAVAPISSVAPAGHPGTVLADGPGDPDMGQQGPGNPSAGQGGGPSNPGAGGGAGDPTMGQG
ncbi:hypothetical protein ABZ942_18945 [Nocardia sp. NPDC046473]|uniref:hypothetical protein n=1 Tax=Nocardia sp. NPDC046473 TaxID=3155733 RepID=UPI0033F0AE64